MMFQPVMEVYVMFSACDGGVCDVSACDGGACDVFSL